MLNRNFHFIYSQISAGKMGGQKKKPGNIVLIVFSPLNHFLFVSSMFH